MIFYMEIFPLFFWVEVNKFFCFHSFYGHGRHGRVYKGEFSYFREVRFDCEFGVSQRGSPKKCNFRDGSSKQRSGVIYTVYNIYIYIHNYGC